MFLLCLDENEATTSFLMQLSTWDKEELDDKLANRVQVSKRAVAKIIQAFDRLMQRNEKITLALKGELEGRKCFVHFDVMQLCISRNGHLLLSFSYFMTIGTCNLIFLIAIKFYICL